MSTIFPAVSEDNNIVSTLSNNVGETTEIAAYGLDATVEAATSQTSLTPSWEWQEDTIQSLSASVETGFSQLSNPSPNLVLIDQLLLLSGSSDVPSNAQLTTATDIDELTGFSQPSGSPYLSGSTSAISSTVIDSLDFHDRFNWNTSKYEEDYLLSGLGNQNVQINLNSSEFDTYLSLIDASTGNILAVNDDSDNDTNSQLNFTTQTGREYLIQVTSYGAFETGGYSLTAYIEDEINTPLPPATPTPTPPALPNNFDSIYGYGLVNAAAAVAAAIGQSTFDDVANRGGLEWNNDMIFVPEVWNQGYTGEGVTVAVIDSGVDITHADLRDSIWVNTDEISGDGIDNDGNGYIDDVHGWNFERREYNNDVIPNNVEGEEHGTHVAGTIVAANDGVGMTGVAYDADVMALRIGGVEGNSFPTAGDLSEAIRYAVDNGADVINMSLGWPASRSIVDALAYAAERNVITVSASGNEFSTAPAFPANYATTYGLSVGAVMRTGLAPAFSNGAGRDSRLHHVMAPGTEIYSTVLNGGYGSSRGTSMAAPHVAGVVALMLSANPNLTHDQVREILIGTAIENPAEMDFSNLNAPMSTMDSTDVFDLSGPTFENLNVMLSPEVGESALSALNEENRFNEGILNGEGSNSDGIFLDAISMNPLPKDMLLGMNADAVTHAQDGLTAHTPNLGKWQFQPFMMDEQPIDEYLIDEILAPAIA